MEQYAFWIGLVIYLLGFIAFGLKTWEHGPGGLSHRVRQFIAVLTWPVYVPLFEPRSIPLVGRLLTGDLLEGAWLLGIFFFPAYYIGTYWDRCSGVWGCTATALKALLWAPFWPAYIAVMIS